MSIKSVVQRVNTLLFLLVMKRTLLGCIVFQSDKNSFICMPEGFLCEINPQEELCWNWRCIFQEMGENVTFWYIIDPGVFRSTLHDLICMPEGPLRERNQL